MRLYVSSALVLVSSSLLVGCTQSAPVTINNNGETPSAQTAPATAASTSASGSSNSTTASGSAASTAASFTDIAGTDGEQAIRNVAALGALDPTSGTFSPNEPITRATYVRWLVKANNQLYKDKPEREIHLAQDGVATFDDVPTTHPDFKYIQGLANAGYVVGVSSTHFDPDTPLTREQMIGIKAQVDEGAAIEKYNGKVADFIAYSDVQEIHPDYQDAVHEDTSVRTTNNISRIWGNIKTLRPQKQLTRSEAAVSLAKIYDRAVTDVPKNPNG
jgi:hypothetical protein